MRPAAWPLLLAAACAARPVPDAPPPPEPPAVLPDGFRADDIVVHEPFLDPEEAWRELLSRLDTLRAEARSRGKDLLVSFDGDAFHATDRDGRRRTWLLPDGLSLEGAPAHVRIGRDLEVRVLGQHPSGEEVTVVVARLRRGADETEEFRLAVKGRRTFRSISPPDRQP